MSHMESCQCHIQPTTLFSELLARKASNILLINTLLKLAMGNIFVSNVANEIFFQ